MHDDLAAMVDKMLNLQKKYHSARLEQDKKLYLSITLEEGIYKLEVAKCDFKLGRNEKTALCFY